MDIGVKGGIHKTAAYKNEKEIKDVLLKKLTKQQQARVKKFMEGGAIKQSSKYKITVL